MSLFPNLSEQLKLRLKNQKVIKTCDLLLKNSSTCFENMNKQIKNDKKVKIGLLSNCVIQICYQSNEIISGFQCHYSIHFEVIRDISFNEDNLLGKTIGIKFMNYSHINQDQYCFLFVQDSKLDEESEKLDEFIRILQKKYIVQIGFNKIFRAVQRIGKGGTACVYRATRLTDGKQVAVKSFKKSTYFRNDDGKGKLAFQKQFKFLTELHNEQICQLFSVFQSQNSIYFIMELLTVSLYKFIQLYGFPNSKICKNLMLDLLQGVAYMHSKGIMHRDLKLQNIMIRGNGPDNVKAVIVDLGLAEYIDNPNFLYLRCGTPGYVAPQIIQCKQNNNTHYNQKCDIFSLGVIFHIMLAKSAVFIEEDVRLVLKSNRQCNIDYQFKKYPQLETQAKKLLAQMLDKNPTTRISVLEALKHNFFKENKNFVEQNSTKNDIDSISILE